MAVDILMAYAQQDELLVNILEDALVQLRRTDRVRIYKHEISQVKSETSTYLRLAHVILLLVSPDFLNSDYVYSAEIAQVIERHKQGEIHVIPVILRPVYWRRTPFAQLQVVPPDTIPLTLWEDQKIAFEKVATTIETIISREELSEKTEDMFSMFTMKAYHNQYLRLGQTTMKAVLSIITANMRKTTLSRVRCLFWSPPGVTIIGVQQVYPTLSPLRLEPDATNPRQQSVELGSFSFGEQRDYLLDLAVTARQPGQRFVMVRPSLKYLAAGTGEREEKADQTAWVYAEWTDVIALAAHIDPRIAHYTGEGDLAQYIEEGQQALDRGDIKRAEHAFGQALEASKRAGNALITRLLNDILEEDANGFVKINENADAAMSIRALAMNVEHTEKLSE